MRRQPLETWKGRFGEEYTDRNIVDWRNPVDAFDLPFKDNYFDLAFTGGVLIHIPLDELPAAIVA